MIRRAAALFLLAALSPTVPAAAQTPLALAEAIARARAHNPDAVAAASVERESVHRLAEARAGYLPRVDAAESWNRGNQPVFVFGSLLAQRRFTQNDFALDALNRPSALDMYRVGVTLEQPLFDRTTAVQVRTAGIAIDMAAVGRRMVTQDLAAAVTDAYGRVLVAAATRLSAAAGVDAALADRDRAAHRRDQGLATDADVLQFEVHVARSRAQQIRADADEQVARTQLNQVMGEPLDATFALDPAPTTAAPVDQPGPSLEADAIGSRPEVRLAALREQLAAAAVAAARAAFLPQVGAQAVWELSGGTWASRTPSWAVGAVARVNLFRGFADRARLAEAREQATRGAVERQKAEAAARVDVRIASARLSSARASDAVGRDAAAQARASQRIIRDRYENGLADAASLLRAAEAVTQAETQQLTAEVDVLVATAALTRALGKQ